MSIYSHFSQIKLTTDQKDVLNNLDTFLESNNQVFVLKGYAGTGKTTLIKGLFTYLKEQSREVEVLAPTGRAAKVLRDKIGIGKTIHSSIYNFKDLESINSDSEEEADHNVRYVFPIRLDNPEEKVIIVDEASMISAKESKNEMFDFGSNILLDDLLTYTFSNDKKNKLIFVGDPAQLPPVTDNASKALDIEYLKALGYNCEEALLTEVKRQNDNAILTNATQIRNVFNQPFRNKLEFQFETGCFEKLPSIDVASTYLNHFPNPDVGDGVIISFSNAQSLQYNNAIRAELFSNSSRVNPGDLLLINSNNYHSYPVALFNGDIAKVVEVSDTPVIQSAPVWTIIDGKNVRIKIDLAFREITIRVPNYDGEISCCIVDSMLNSELRDLSPDELKALYINFVIRFREEQLERHKKGLPSYKVGSQQFKDQLKTDPYYNALRVKYGYAITCHKAQGGEWDTVFVDYYGRVGLKDDQLRWSYTATTRGINLLYAINPPHFSPMDRIKSTSITKVKQLGKNIYDFTSVPVSPYHTVDQHRGKSLKYWELLEQFEETSYKIKKVESFGDFLERYTIALDDDTSILVQASHNGSGLFVDNFKVLNLSNDERTLPLKEIMNRTKGMNFPLSYTPSGTSLELLFNVIQAACEEVEASITNIVEEKDKYYVKYYLLTDANSSIQFYFNKDIVFSRAMPQSLLGDEDEKLQSLISKINSYAK